MAKVQNLSGIQQEIAFTEFDFYQLYEKTFQGTEPERIRKFSPFRKNIPLPKPGIHLTNADVMGAVALYVSKKQKNPELVGFTIKNRS